MRGKSNESFSASLFTFRSHFAVICCNWYYVFVTVEIGAADPSALQAPYRLPTTPGRLDSRTGMRTSPPLSKTKSRNQVCSTLPRLIFLGMISDEVENIILSDPMNVPTSPIVPLRTPLVNGLQIGLRMSKFHSRAVPELPPRRSPSHRGTDRSARKRPSGTHFCRQSP